MTKTSTRLFVHSLFIAVALGGSLMVYSLFEQQIRDHAKQQLAVFEPLLVRELVDSKGFHGDRLWFIQQTEKYKNALKFNDIRLIPHAEHSKIAASRSVAGTSRMQALIPIQVKQPCSACHNIADTQTYGALHITFAPPAFLKTLLKTGGGVVLLLTVIYFLGIWLAYRYKITSLKEIEKTLDYAIGGDLHTRTPPLDKNIGVIAYKLNRLLDIFKLTVSNIDRRLSGLIGETNVQHINPLDQANRTIQVLSDISLFKKRIEGMDQPEAIYRELGSSLYTMLNLFHLQLYEKNDDTDTFRLVYSSNGKAYCSVGESYQCQLCPALTSNEVVSITTVNHDLCQSFHAPLPYHLCIPFTISANRQLLAMVIAKSDRGVEDSKKMLPIFSSFMESAKPIIETKILLGYLQELSIKDTLTGLYNRRYLEDFVTKIAEQARRANVNFGVLIIDLDKFKAVNDTYGHSVGDAVIKELGKTLKVFSRDSDIALRYGGEEFCLFLYNVTRKQALEISEKIRLSFETRFVQADGQKVQTTFSGGLSIFPIDAQTLEQCLKCADIALYKAKEKGRNRIIDYDIL